jgi:hypothetical protein
VKKTLVAASAALIPLALVTAPSAVASSGQGRMTTDISCDGYRLTVTTAGGNDGNNWGSAQVSGGGHLVLAALEYRVDDVTVGVTLDDEVLANGRAHEQQRTIACEVASEEVTLGDVAPEGFVYPEGTAGTDKVVSSLQVTVVPRP